MAVFHPKLNMVVSLKYTMILFYGCNTWGNTTAVTIEHLSKLQKRAARIILRVDLLAVLLTYTRDIFMFVELYIY